MDKYHKKLVEKINESIGKNGKNNAIVLMKNDKSEVYLRYDQIPSKFSNSKKSLNDAGIDIGCRVAVVAEHSAYSVFLNLELAYIGVKAVLIDPSLPDEIINRLIDESDVSGLFISASKHKTFRYDSDYRIPIFLLLDDFTFRLIDSFYENSKRKVEKSEEDVVAIIFSSGTTGVNKGVEITYESLLYTYKWCNDYNILNSKTRFFDVIPSNHIAGYSTAMSSFPSGTEIDFIEEMNVASLSAGLLRFNPRNFIMIPKVYEVMMSKIKEEIRKKGAVVRVYASFAMKTCSFVRKITGVKLRFLTKPIWKKAFGNSMLIVGSGTAPCKKEVAEFYLDLGMNFMDVYGSTETGLPITSTNVFEKYPLDGSGKVTELPYVKIKISNPDKDGVGEILVKTRLIMKGYYKDPELTQASFDEDGFFCTGDLGYVDEEKNLHIVGRIKESIVLSNGKKVSPADVDEFYKTLCPDIVLASCGITGDEGCDEIHLFIEKKNHTDEEIKQAVKRIQAVSDNESYYRRLSGLHIVECIPTTSIGKVKRYCLKDCISENEEVVVSESCLTDEDLSVVGIIQKYAPESISIDGNMRLDMDIGLDSLSLFEMCADIQQAFGVDIADRLKKNITVKEIEKIICGKSTERENDTYDIRQFPRTKTKKDIDRLTKFAHYSDKKWEIRINGIENIKDIKKCILCPNHESHLDSLWVVSALYLNGVDIRKNCTCMGAEYVMFSKILGKGFRALGGIPVDRSGNATKAFKRALEYFEENDSCVMLIHPEGTRTRDGKLGDFKNGAAELSIKADVPIVPICINGAREIYPPNHRLPSRKRIYGRKQVIEINIGRAIFAEDKTTDVITDEIKGFISKTKKNKK